MPIQLAGNVKYGGLVEAAFGAYAGRAGRRFRRRYGHRPADPRGAGRRPARCLFSRALFDTPFDYEAFAAKNGLIGHGGVVVFDDTVDMARQARFAMEFCAIESCGKCTPCRIGSVRGVEVIDRIMAGERRSENLALLRDLCETMLFGSLCALGGFMPLPGAERADHFPEDFGMPASALPLRNRRPPMSLIRKSTTARRVRVGRDQ